LYLGSDHPRKLALADFSSCVLLDNGLTYCWGNNGNIR